MAEIEAKKVNIGTLFSENYRFEIPIFQRPFSWRRNNFEDLFDYIYDAFESNQEEYFLGTIILQEKGQVYYIIDGQQRLVSLAILFAVIRDNIRDEGIKKEIQESLFQEEKRTKGLPEVIRIKMWDDLKEIEEIIYKQDKIKDYEKYKNSQNAYFSLYEAVDTFLSKYKENFKEDHEVENFLKYLNKNVYVIVVTTKSLSYGIQLFNVLNTTGLPLTSADILKALNLAEIDMKNQEEYFKKWRKIEEEIGRDEIDKIIEYIRVLKLKSRAKRTIIEEYDELIFKKGIIKKGKEFFDYFIKISNIYKDLVLEPEELNINPKYKHLVRLMKEYLRFESWILPLLAFYEKFENLKNIYYLLNQFLIYLEKKTVIELVIKFTKTERIESLIKFLKIIEEKDKPEEVIDEIKIKEEEIKNEFKTRIDHQYFYYESYAKYLLLRLDLEKWDLENFGGYQGVITVEHILPRNPSETSEWSKLFDDQQREIWTNKIGNLVLISRRKNSSAQNYDFKTKKEMYFLRGGSTPFKITEEIKDLETWDMEALKKRQERLVNELLNLYFE